MTINRIRWDLLLGGNFDGYVGTRTEPAFKLFLATPGSPTPWALRSELLEGYSTGTQPDDLKAEAGDWLERFVSSLGAVFPDDRPACHRCGEPVTGTPVTADEDALHRAWCSEECRDAAAEASYEQRYQPGVATWLLMRLLKHYGRNSPGKDEGRG